MLNDLPSRDADISAIHEPPDAYPAPAAAWYTVGVLFVIYFVYSLDRFIISLLVDPIRKDLQISDFQVGLLQGAFSLMFALGTVPIGHLVDRWLRRWVIFLGMVCWSVATTASGLATNFWQLFLARVGVGAGECALSPAAYSILADSFPKERLTFATATSMLGTSAGQGLGITLGGFTVAALTVAGPQSVPFLGELHPWQLVFIAVGLPGVLLSPLIFTIKEPPRRRDGHSLATAPADVRASISPYWQFFKTHRRFILGQHLGIAFALLVQAGIGTWLPVYMTRELALDAARVGEIYGVLYGLCTPLGLVLGGFIIDRLFRRGYRDAHLRVFSVCVLLAIPFGIVALRHSSFGVFIAGSALTQLFLGVLPAAGASSLQIVTPSYLRGRASAVFLVTYVGLGGTLGPALVGFITGHIFHNDTRVGDSISTLIAVFAPLSALALWFAMRPMRQAVAAEMH